MMLSAGFARNPMPGMENRKPETGNRKPEMKNGEGQQPVSSFLFRVFGLPFSLPVPPRPTASVP
jgi:hypothetical protein